MRLLNEAWAVLEDSHSRAEYDRWLAAGKAPQGFDTTTRYRPPGPGECMFCGSSPAVAAELRQNVGLIIFRRVRSIGGPFCRDCGLSMFRAITSRTLLTGWWGVVSFFANIGYVITNIAARTKFAQLATPRSQPNVVGIAPQPLDPGKPLFQRTGFIAVAVVVVVAAISGISDSLTSRGTGGRAAPTDHSPSPTAPAAAPAEAAQAGFVRFHDEQAGIAIAYPANWERLESPDPHVVIAATLNGRDGFVVRRSELDFPVTTDNLDSVRALTGDIVTANEDVQVLTGPEPIELAGLPGHFYLYTFTDESGERGAHSHYFLFGGDVMISLVFQALPSDQFAELAPAFDQIAESLEVAASNE